MLITVTLLAFLVVLLIGLASYSRIETAIAGNTQRQTQARQNALLALDVALGQLQKFAGPDQRVTATADSFGGANGTRHFTGVWDTTQAASTTPATWLVSGNEYQNGATSVTPATAFTATDSIELVGLRTVGTARDVVAKLQPVTSVGVPGVTGATAAVIGRYAWWVGDQGVKASVAVADNSASVNYAPWDSTELRNRLQQQVPLGAGATDGSGSPVFDPRNAVNSLLVANQKVTAYNQLAFLRNTSAVAIGLTPLRTYFHIWSPNNFNVLANTKLGGLRQDLSLDATLLGSVFAAWADYSTYMEAPADASASPYPPLPEFPSDVPANALRRRYKITPTLFSSDTGIAPVLSYFYLQVGVRKSATASPYAVSVRGALALWNPYTSALVPEDLKIEISGLPNSLVTMYLDSATSSYGDDASIALGSIFGDPLKVSLPWAATSTTTPQERSWLPGRVYNWTWPDAATSSGSTVTGQFNSRDIPGFDNGVTGAVGGSSSVGSTTQLAVRVGKVTLTVKVKRTNGDLLATYTSPTYDAVTTTTPGDASNSTSQLGYLFRLAESVDSTDSPNAWLTTAGRDPRSGAISKVSLLALPNGTDPSAYRNYTTVSAPTRLVDRDKANLSYNGDVPLFELPRCPLLSLGELQHLYIDGARPFTIGNSWSSGTTLNSIDALQFFDRFYFSGLVAGVTPATVNGSLLLPNPQLKVLRNSSTGGVTTVDELRAVTNSQSSKFLLQGAAFNVNSVNAAAWSAVFRSVRFPAPSWFAYLTPSEETGTIRVTEIAPQNATDVTATTTPVSSADARFFRFSQSAQETYKVDGSGATSELFRQGMRTLTPAQVSALGAAVVTLIKAHQAASGPFRSLEEFLAPTTAGSSSLLEQAISDANINVDSTGAAIEFSSQFLTQADIMTALAPVLFPRSDTFVIRTYGEAVNPTTAATEGRAWCEAIVHRVPEYVDSSAATGDAAEVAPSALTSDLNKAMGRRFKVVSFRWLTRSDI